MKTMKFKTNLDCQVCIDAVSSVFKSDQRIFSWKVDTEHPDKILTVTGEIGAGEVASKVKSIGYMAKEITEKD